MLTCTLHIQPCRRMRTAHESCNASDTIVAEAVGKVVREGRLESGLPGWLGGGDGGEGWPDRVDGLFWLAGWGRGQGREMGHVWWRDWWLERGVSSEKKMFWSEHSYVEFT